MFLRNLIPLNLISLLILILNVGAAFAANNGYAPHTMNFNGYLTATNGTPESGAHNMRFVLYENGVATWAAEYTAVTVSNGQFSVVLGSSSQGGLGIVPATYNSATPTYSGADLPIIPALLSSVDSTVAVALELRVWNGSSYDILSPQFTIASALFALQSETAQTSLSTEAIQGIAVSSTAPTANQVLQYDGTQWLPTSLSASSAAAGANSQVQFNSSGSLGASASFTWDNTNGRLAVGGAIAPASQL